MTCSTECALIQISGNKKKPEWWLPSSTQYGLLTRWRVDADGCYLNDERISGVTLEQLTLTDKPYISLKIGVKADAVHQGGINLFGEQFGDHQQAIVMRLDCAETLHRRQA